MAMTDSTSPLKSWIKKHSPIKSRNKPLPAHPVEDGSPQKPRPRAPGRAISGNSSPTKPTFLDSQPGHRVAKRKISALWRGSQAHDTHEGASTRHRRVASSPTKFDERPSTGDSAEDLSERVTTLEAQLRAAKTELAHASGTVVQSSQWKGRPTLSRRIKSSESHGDIDRSIKERQNRLLRGHHYDGVVESLLERDYASASRKAVSYSVKGQDSPERRSASAAGFYETAMADYKNLENSYADEGESMSALDIARQRSELRAAEWKRMQGHLATHKKQAGSKRNHDDLGDTGHDRPSRRQRQETSRQDKALPELPQQNRKRATGSVRSKNAVSKSGDLETTTAHVIQYVHVKPQSSDAAQVEACSVETAVGEAAEGQDDENITIFCDNDDEEFAPPSPYRWHIPSPSRLHTVDEEFEWNDEEIF